MRVSFDIPCTRSTSPARARCGCSRRSARRGVGAALLPGVLVGDVRLGAAARSPRRRRSTRAARTRVAKVAAYWSAVNYREAYGLFAVNGILFNHESPRRGETFVTRKITRARRAHQGRAQDKLYLGNLEAKRDWGFAPDYVEAMWRMLQADEPDDYVVATGETHTVREFCERAFSRLDLDWEEHVEIDPRYYRPTEVDSLLGDASKAAREARLGAHGRVRGAGRDHGRRRRAAARAISSPARSTRYSHELS